MYLYWPYTIDNQNQNTKDILHRKDRKQVFSLVREKLNILVCVSGHFDGQRWSILLERAVWEIRSVYPLLSLFLPVLLDILVIAQSGTHQNMAIYQILP